MARHIVASYAYTFYSTGRRSSVTEGSGRAVKWLYDGAWQLTQESITGGLGDNGVAKYFLDAAGNRLQLQSTLARIAPQALEFDRNDHMSIETYDNNGNVLSSNLTILAFDSNDRLASANSGQISYSYDGDGIRVGRSTSIERQRSKLGTSVVPGMSSSASSPIG